MAMCTLRQKWHFSNLASHVWQCGVSWERFHSSEGHHRTAMHPLVSQKRIVNMPQSTHGLRKEGPPSYCTDMTSTSQSSSQGAMARGDFRRLQETERMLETYEGDNADSELWSVSHSGLRPRNRPHVDRADMRWESPFKWQQNRRAIKVCSRSTTRASGDDTSEASTRCIQASIGLDVRGMHSNHHWTSCAL